MFPYEYLDRLRSPNFRSSMKNILGKFAVVHHKNLGLFWSFKGTVTMYYVYPLIHHAMPWRAGSRVSGGSRVLPKTCQFTHR